MTEQVPGGPSQVATAEAKAFPIKPGAGVAIFWLGLFTLLVGDHLLGAAVTESVWYAAGLKLALNLLVVIWLLSDSSRWGWEAPRVQLYAILSMLFTEICVPIYLVKTRGWKGAGKSVLWFLGYSVLFIIALLIVDPISKALFAYG